MNIKALQSSPCNGMRSYNYKLEKGENSDKNLKRNDKKLDVSSSQKIIENNLLGTIYCCQLIAPLMMRIKYGSIINFSTIATSLGLKGESVYIASKAGVEGFTRSFAREMADFNVNVNCIAPGPIDTNLLKGITAKQINKIVSQQIIPKQFSPEAICDLVELLLDSKSSSISGQVLNVGGV